MLSHIARVFLAIAVVSAGGIESFAHIHPHGQGHDTVQPDDALGHGHSALGHRAGAHWHLTGPEAAEKPGTTRFTSSTHRHPSVRVEVLAVERSSGRLGATSALGKAWRVEIVPVACGRHLSIVTKARPDLPPRIVLPARAPPFSLAA